MWQHEIGQSATVTDRWGRSTVSVDWSMVNVSRARTRPGEPDIGPGWAVLGCAGPGHVSSPRSAMWRIRASTGLGPRVGSRWARGWCTMDHRLVHGGLCFALSSRCTECTERLRHDGSPFSLSRGGAHRQWRTRAFSCYGGSARLLGALWLLGLTANSP
jgi:hypothetical protein